jgi:hypothetical protein
MAVLSRKQWGYHNCIELTDLLCTRFGWFGYFVTLTSKPDSDSSFKSLQFAYHELIQRFVRKYGMKPVHVRIETSEGFGVLHCFWYFERALPRVQRWLSSTWLELRGASRVWITAIDRKEKTKLFDYAASQSPIASLISYGVKQNKKLNGVEVGGTTIVKVTYSKSPLFPYSMKNLIIYSRRILRSEVYSFSPWQCSYAQVLDMCRALVVSGLYVHPKGYSFMCNEMTDWSMQIMERQIWDEF